MAASASSTRPPSPPAPAASPATAHPSDVPQGRRPHFFKVFFPCHSSKRLGIPPGFWKHIEHQTPRGVSLIGPSGNVWSVDLVRDGDGGISFQNGWNEFVGDHSLETGDFLLFRYDGELRFTVVVFGSTACEKEEAFHVVPCEEVMVLGESCPRQCATDFPAKELIILDPNTDRALLHKSTGGRLETLVATSQEIVKNNTDPVESRPEGRPHVNDGSIVTNEDNIDGSSEQDLLAPQIKPTLLHNLQPDGDANSDGTPTFRHSMCKEPRGSNRYPPCWKQSSQGQLNHVIREVKDEPQSDQDTSSANSGESVPKARRRTKMEANKSYTLSGGSFKGSTQKHKEPAAMRSTHKRNGSAVKQPHCSKCSRCSVSSKVDDVRIKVRMGYAMSCRGPVTEPEKAKALEAASAFKSEHPVAICVMRDSYVYYGYYMNIPISFIQHLPNRSMKMQLWDPSNRPWKVMYIHYKGRGGFSAGWGKFVRANNLESDDVCAFELLKPYEMRVHIFRVVDEIIPLIWTNPRRKE